MMNDWVGSFEGRNYAVKRQTELRNLADMLWLLLSLSALAGVLVFQSWERSQIVSIGYETQQLQTLEESLARAERALTLEETTLKDPARIEDVAHSLGLSPVRANQLVASHPAPPPDVIALAGDDTAAAAAKKVSDAN